MQRQSILLCFALLLFCCKENHDVPNHTPGIVKVVDGLLMVAYGEGGIVITDEATGAFVSQIFPTREMNSIDDFTVEDNLLFALDTRGRDFVAVYSLSNGVAELVNPPTPVEGGPFNGISARNGNLVVSGGTTFLNRFTYAPSGDLSRPISFGRDRGHPDVLLSSDGQAAFISADFGIGLDIDRFGIMSLFIGDDLKIPSVISELGIAEAGFTAGVTTPVGFPIQAAIYNDNLLVAHGGGLTIIELSNNIAFETSRTFDFGVSGIAITVVNDRAIITGYQNEDPVLATIDLTETANPVLESVRALSVSDNVPTSVAAGSNAIYVAAGAAGLLTFPL